MSAYDELMRALQAERNAPRPKPYRNERHDYLAEIAELRAAFRQLVEQAESEAA